MTRDDLLLAETWPFAKNGKVAGGGKPCVE